jgi:hypothetical protein
LENFGNFYKKWKKMEIGKFWKLKNKRIQKKKKVNFLSKNFQKKSRKY